MQAVSAAIGPLVPGREAESRELARWLGRDEPGYEPVLLLEGPAGMGKTLLWERACAAARERGYQVLACRPAESEAPLTFAALADCLEPLLDQHLAELAAPQRAGIEAALLRAAVPGGIEPLAVPMAVLSLLRMAGRTGPVLLAIDDAHWLDAGSARVFEFVLRRLRSWQAGSALVTWRPAPGDDAPLGLGASSIAQAVRGITLGPVDAAALHRILSAVLAEPVPRSALLRIHAASAGNPFLAIELAVALRTVGWSQRPGQPLPVPGTLDGLLRRRLGVLTASTKQVLAAAAAMPAPTAPGVARAIGGKAAADTALAEAQAAGVISRERPAIRFTHPLLAAVLYADLDPGERRSLHQRLAAACAEPDERARHLALAVSGPDEKVAWLLDEAARSAWSRGSPAAAAELLELAATLTPPGGGTNRQRRFIGAADYLLQSGDTRQAGDLLRQQMSEFRDTQLRFEACRMLGLVGFFGGDPAGALRNFTEAGRLADGDPARSCGAEESLSWYHHMEGNIDAAARHADAAVGLAGRAGDPGLLLQALNASAWHGSMLGAGIRRGAIDRALALEAGTRHLRVQNSPRWPDGILLMWADDLDGARARFTGVISEATQRGEVHALPYFLAHLSLAESRAGDWPAAERHASEAIEIAVETGQDRGLAFAWQAQSTVDALYGRVDAAMAGAERGLEVAERSRTTPAAFGLRWVLGFTEMPAGDAAAAAERLVALAGDVDLAGLREPGFLPHVPDAADALITLGRLADAETLLGELGERAGRLGRRSALAAAARCHARLLAATGDLSGAEAAVEESMREYAAVTLPFERARAMLVRGQILRRRKRKADARDAITAAAAEFERLGAARWHAAATAELGRIPARPGRPDELSATELRIARMVCSGSTNQEAADQLFLSVRTVEWNLSKIYRKLGVRSRTELANRLGAPRTTSDARRR